MARKSKYTPDVVTKIVEAIKNGATYELAAGYAGISFQTFNEWRKSKPEFSEAIKSAEGQGAMTWLTMIEHAAALDWHAAAWKLERRYPSKYGRTVQTQEHTGTVEVAGRVVLVMPRRSDDPNKPGGQSHVDSPATD